MRVPNIRDLCISGFLALAGIAGLIAGSSAGAVLHDIDASQRHWAVVTEVAEPSSFTIGWRTVKAHQLGDPSQLYEIKSVRALSTPDVGDRLILASDRSEPPRYVLATQINTAQPFFAVAGRHFSWHAGFGYYSLLLAALLWTPWWQRLQHEQGGEDAPASIVDLMMISGICLLAGAAMASFASNTGRLASAVDDSQTLRFIVETTEKVPSSRFHGLFDSWYAVGILADSNEASSVPISQSQYLSMAAGDELQVHPTSLPTPKHVKATSNAATEKVYWIFGLPFSAGIFLGFFLAALGIFVFFAPRKS